MMRCVDKFAPEQETTVRKVSNDWVTKNLKNEITRRNKFFQKWIKCPTEESSIFKKTEKHGDNIDKKCQTPE